MKKGNILTLTVILLSIKAMMLAGNTIPATMQETTPSTAPNTAEQTNITVITIKTDDVAVKYLQSVYTLAKNTTYNITFINTQTLAHNVVIAENRTVETEEDAVEKPGDILIGPSGNDLTATGPGQWSILWTTPAEDTIVVFFCSFPGHFAAGMRGYFKIGNPPDDLIPKWAQGGLIPGFGALMSLLVLIPVSGFILKKRKE